MEIPSNSGQNRIFIIGYGDIGRRVARLYKEKNYIVAGLARSPESWQMMQDDDGLMIVFLTVALLATYIIQMLSAGGG